MARVERGGAPVSDQYFTGRPVARDPPDAGLSLYFT